VIDKEIMIDIIKELREAKGVDIHNKKYTTVATRLEIFRKHTGFNYGIISDIVTYGTAPGEKTVIKTTITDKNGFVVGAGTAEEIIGSGNINKTSALENCESSSWGRALASLGIHGGEIASFDEIEIAKGKEQKLDKKTKPKPEDQQDKLAAAEKYVEEQMQAIQTMNPNALIVWTQQESDNLKSLADLSKNLHTKLFNAYKERKQNGIST
jgi:hypothetical protein